MENRNVYKGHRYVPKIMGVWDQLKTYEGLSIVTWEGTSYTSKKRVPEGVDISNEEYWVVTGNYNAQVENYRQEVLEFDNRIENNTAQLAQIENNIYITPDDFEGSDIEKIQQALDFASENDITTVKLNRTYDVTGGSIFLKEENWGTKNVTFTSGTIVKNDDGFVFDRNSENKSSDSPIFINTRFTANAKAILYNGSVMIRQKVYNCSFNGMSFVKANGYLQSIRLVDCLTEHHHTNFIEANMVFDGLISGHQGETSQNSFVDIQTDNGNDISAFNFRITDSLIEGYTNSTPIVMSAGYGISITGCYFEANKTSIRFVKGVGTERLHASLHNLTFGATKSNYDIEFVGFPMSITFVSLENITSNVPKGKFLTNLTTLYREFKNISVYAGGKIADTTGRFEVIQKNSFESTTNDLGAEGIEIEFKIPLNRVDNLNTLSNKQYLVNITAGFSTSTLYSGHVTGIVSIDGYYSTDKIVQGLNFTELSERNTSGVTNGNLGNASNYSYYFKETQSKEIDSYAKPVTVVFKFPKLNNSNVVTTMTPINSIISELDVDR